MRKFNLIHCLILTMCSASVLAEFNQQDIKAKVIKETKHDTSIPLTYLFSSNNYNAKTIKQILNDQINLAKAPLIHLTGFTGIGSSLPNYQVKNATPDVAASVGLTQYVQWADNHIAVFDKSTGSIASGFPKLGNSIWAGFGGPCETSNVGMQTVKYDQIAGKWLLSQIAFDNVNGPAYQCLAVSTGEDATGSYNRYAFQLDSMTSTAKLGVWSDAYYLALNLAGPPFEGTQICALDRNKIIAGQASTMQCFNFMPSPIAQNNMQPSLFFTPADLDGLVAPPAGSPGYFVALNPPQNLIITKFSVDFTNSANSKLTHLILPVGAYVNACNANLGNSCAIQPNTTNRLNVYSDRIMSRVAYRQFGNYGSMLLNHTVEGPVPKKSPAIRWYELRVYKNNTSFDPVVNQQETFAPDSMNRFTGSIAIDRFTNIAIGYTVTSSLISPSLELGYHNYNDEFNLLARQALVTSTGSQVDNVMDWGRGASMSVDPVDECTFWFSGEYLNSTGSLNWSTAIVKFKLKACT